MAASVGMWADEITATLSHTAGTRYGSAATVANTVDSEAEYYNNDAKSGWAGFAFAEFSFAIPEGHTVTSATLTWTATNGGKANTKRSHIVYYLNAGTSLDYEAIASKQDLYMYSDSRTKIVTESFANTATMTTDVTEAVKAIAASQSNIIFQWTGNAASATLAGKASEKAPMLTITTSSASSMTKYTVNYLDEEGNVLKTAATYDAAIGAEATASDEDMAPFYVGAQKYIYKSGNATIEVMKEAADNVINLTFRKAATFTYTVNAVDGDGNVLKEIATGSKFELDKDTVAFGKYLKVDSVLYKGTQGNCGWWRNEYTLSEDKAVFTVKYTKSEDHVAAFVEAEDVEGLTPTSAGNADIRCSWAKGAYNAGEEAVTLFTLQPGVYKLVANVWGNKTANIVVNYGEETDWEISLVGYLKEESKEEVTIKAETPVVLKTCGSSTKCLDLIYAVKTGEYVAPETKASTIAELKALDDYTDVTFTATNVVVTCASQMSMTSYVQDATGALAIDYSLRSLLIELGYDDGKAINGTLYCQYYVNNGVPTLTIADKTGESEVTLTDATAEPVEIAAADFSKEENICKYVIIKGGKLVGNSAEGMTLTATDGTTISVYDSFFILADDYTIDGDVKSVKGIITKDWGGNLVLAPYGKNAIEAVPTGVESLKAETVKAQTIYNVKGQKVSNLNRGLYIINGKKAVVK